LPIKFKCKHCGEVLKVRSRDAGKLGKCKQCRRPVRAPILTALPDEQPANKYTTPQRGRTGLLSELKAHPLWCIAGTFAFIMLVGAVILLNISGKTDPQSIDLGADKSDIKKTENAYKSGPNETDSKPEEKNEVAGSTIPKPNDNVLTANLTEEELTSLPVWAQIILDQELFPDGETWNTAEDAFEDKCSLDPSIRNNPKELQSIEALSYRLSPLEPKDISEKYGPARIIIQEIDWYRYGLISFGKKMGDDHFSEIRAPVELFTKGFVETAKNSGISRIVSTDTLRSKVVIINSHTKTVGFSFSGCGPYFLDPNDRKVLTLPAGNYSVDVTSEDKAPVVIPAAACDGAVWLIKSNPQNPESAHLFVEANQDSSGPSLDSPEVELTLINKYTAVVSARVGYDGRYYRLKPDQQQVLHLREKKYVVCIESDNGRSSYQVAQASQNIAWDINATLDERNFCIDVNNNPVIPDQFPELDAPAQPIAGGFDPNQPVGQVQVFEGHLDAVSNVTFSPDGSKVLSCGGGKDKTIRLWDIGAEAELQCFEESQQSITELAFSSDGRYVWSYNSADYSACYFNLQTGEEFGGFKQHICTSRTVAFSRSAQHLLVADKALFLWELETGELSLSFKPQQESNSTEQVKKIALSPDGQHVLVGFDSGNLQLWRMDEENSKGIPIHQLSGHKAWINSLDFSPDGQLAVSGSGYCKLPNSTEKNLKGGLGFDSVDCMVRVWNLDTGQEIACFDGHKMPVTTVAFSPDGQRILSGGYDNTVRLWDIGSSKELLRCSKHTGPVNSVAFSPDGRLAVSASNDRTVRVWKLPEPIEVVKEDISESEGDKVIGEIPEPATSKQSKSNDQQRLTIRRSVITQIAPAVRMTGQKIVMWPILNNALGVVQADDEDFLWLLAYVEQRSVKEDVPKMSIRDVNDNEVGSLYAWVDASAYSAPGISILSFDGKGDSGKIMIAELSDQNAAELLYNLAAGIWGTQVRGRDRYVLLIFKGKYESVEGLYLDGPNTHVPLHQSQRRLRRNTQLKAPAPRIGSSRQNIERDNTLNSRERSGRTSSRRSTR